MSTVVSTERKQRASRFQVTDRERAEILRLLGKGLAVTLVARRMGFGLGTVQRVRDAARETA